MSRRIPAISSPVFESREAVGSSARRIFGSRIKARAMATLCFSPPLSSPGLRCFLLPILRRSRHCCAFIRDCSPLSPAMCDEITTLSNAVSDSNSRNAWNTKPSWSRRIVVRSSSVATVGSLPFTNTEPSSGVRRHPRTDSRVVFPLPDGPITKVSEPAGNDNETSESARIEALPTPWVTLMCSTESMDSDTKNPRRLHRKSGTNRHDGCKHAHQQGREEHGQRQPPRCVYPSYNVPSESHYWNGSRQAQYASRDATGQGLVEDHVDYKSLRGAKCLQSCEFVQMFHGGCVDRLRNYDQSNQESENSCCEDCGSGASLANPI